MTNFSNNQMNSNGQNPTFNVATEAVDFGSIPGSPVLGTVSGQQVTPPVQEADVGMAVASSEPVSDFVVPTVKSEEPLAPIADNHVSEVGERQPLRLFLSQPQCCGVANNTSFSTEPIEVKSENVSILKFDYTTIRFKNGYRRKDNFDHALTVPGDTDNSHSDNPEDWLTQAHVSAVLAGLGINHWVHSSRNDELPKGGQSPRPKFHVLLPLSKPLFDKEIYEAMCRWYIRKFQGDPMVKSCGQQMFGFGDHPNPTYIEYNSGRCIDEVLTDADLTPDSTVPVETTPSQDTSATSTVRPPLQTTNRPGDDFNGRGRDEVKSILARHGWHYIREDGTNEHWCRPGKDPRTGQTSATLYRNEPLFHVFSSNAAPFVGGKTYNFFHVYAILEHAGDYSAAAKELAQRGFGATIPSSTGAITGQPPADQVIIGIDVLDALLEQVDAISFSDGKEPTNSDYYVRSIDWLLYAAAKQHWDIAVRHEAPHFYTGEFWLRVDQRMFRYFLQTAALKQGVPYKTAKDHQFVDKLVKQFASEARFPVLSRDDIPKINLRNGTLHFTPGGVELKPFDKRDGLCYQLGYGYDPSATAPLFKKFFERVQPDAAVRKLLFQYVGYVFMPKMNLEKILFLSGGGDNGKSVFMNIVQALVGGEQCCDYSLEGLAKSEYQRAELGNYLLNVCTELSTRLGGTDIFKKLASRETLQGRHPYGRPFNVRDYATSIFSMNTLPADVEQTKAFFRRFLIVPFDVTISEEEKDTELAAKIISSEMSGVMNYVVEGVGTLLAERKFDIPRSIHETVDTFRQESDTVLMFLTENGYRSCTVLYRPLREMYSAYKEQCIGGGHQPVSITKFSQRLRSLGYKVAKIGKMHQTIVYLTQDHGQDYSPGDSYASGSVAQG